MLKSSYQLCTLFGIPIRLDASLIILFIILISSYRDPVWGIGAGLVLLLSITLHELGHSLVAKAFGCRVKDITLMIIGGCASMVTLPQKAWQELLVALAGPAVSLVLGLLGLFVLPQLVVDSSRELAQFIVLQVGYLNAGLFLFNLLPAFPMDGGRVLRALLQQFFMGKAKATWIASRIGKFIAILFALSVLWSWLFNQFESWYFTRLLIAYFIYRSAEQEYRMVLMEEGREPFTPFWGSFFNRQHDEPPEDDGKVVIGPAPYDRWGGKTRVDIHRDDR